MRSRVGSASARNMASGEVIAVTLPAARATVKREPLVAGAPLWHGRTMILRRSMRLSVSLAPLALLAGCATVPGQDRLAEKDPLEKLNRGIWAVDQTADKIVMKPVTKAYRAVTPTPVRQGISNFFANLTEPWSLVNNLLQGKPKRAGRNLERFVVNSTIGLAGFIDHASKIGIRPAQEDLGQTFAVWGVNGGPYLVLPLLGPSTMRDAIGSGIAAYGDPVNVAINQADVNVWYKRGFKAAQIVSARSDLIESGGDAFLESSLDPYAAARSAFLQHRRAEILDQEDNGGATGLPDAPAPAAEAVPTPSGDAASTAPASGQSAAPLPGDEPAPASASPLPGGDQPSSTPSAAPLPGDDQPAAAPAQPKA
jgi:phospholipid-binding lipoprotein MlaA